MSIKDFTSLHGQALLEIVSGLSRFFRMVNLWGFWLDTLWDGIQDLSPLSGSNILLVRVCDQRFPLRVVYRPLVTLDGFVFYIRK